MATSAYASAAHMSGKQLRKSFPLVDRFLIREHRIQAEIGQMGEARNMFERRENAKQYNNLIRRVINPTPFTGFRNPETGRFIPPRLSLRRQAQLGKQAYAEGRFDELIQQIDQLNFGSKEYAGVKLNKMRNRIAEIKAEEQDLIEKSMSGELEEMSVIQAVDQQIPKQTPDQVKRLAKALAMTRGPYKGRSKNNIFKGTLHARQGPKKRQNISDRLSKMDQTIVDWRKQRKDVKTKAKPKLPF